jgi:5,10-methenyltetrahydromethanopterin hydrogenase
MVPPKQIHSEYFLLICRRRSAVPALMEAQDLKKRFGATEVLGGTANFVQLIKYSSLASVISVSEITRRGMELSATAFRPLEIFTFIAVVYFAICWPLAMAIRFWERRLANR